MSRWLSGLIRLGNRLPDPVFLFVGATAAVALLSALGAALGWAVPHPAGGGTIQVRSAFEPALVERLLTEMPRTFAGFPPLGTVLVMMLGIAVAERSGLLDAALGGLVRRVPPRALSAALVFAGVMSSLAADAGYVVLVPLGAALFAAAGRPPLAGLAATFAGVSAGFSANLLLTALDPLLAGLTEAAARLLEPGRSVSPACNYYLMAALVPLYTLAGAWVTERWVAPRRAGETAAGPVPAPAADPAAARGLRAAGWVALAWLGLVLWLLRPEGGALRAEDGGLAPFYRALVALMFLLFFACGWAYGRAVGRFRRGADLIGAMQSGMADMAYYLVLAFFAAHFIALFDWTGLGRAGAVLGAQGLAALAAPAPVLLLGLVLLSGLVNLFIGSASAKWALLAPVFVPMFMLLGLPPEATQAAYRIGDSATNIVTPLMPYFPLVLVFARRYRPELGIGGLIGLMWPYALVFAAVSTLALLLWWAAGWPLGPA
ncbi:MAG: aminobenzoyl-glutamate transporter [Gammaproteobacteria bacterium]|nr:MAG: aminobenzoyl-glutamate transporter [Gammaproteobacteria bacterium]